MANDEARPIDRAAIAKMLMKLFDNWKLREAKWLMSNDVAAYLEKPFRTSLDELAAFLVVLDGHDPGSPEYDWGGHDARLAERTRMYDHIVAKVDELFSPFLTLKH